MIKEIITTSYAVLKKSKAGDFANVKSELDLLGISYDDNSLAIAYKITQSSKSLKDTLSNLDKHEKSGTIETILSDVKEEIKTNEEKKKKVAETKKKKQEATKALASQKKLTLEAAKINNPYLNIVDYKVIREKNLFNMESKVKEAIKQGWSPLGGVAGIAFGMSTHGGNSFAQALVKFKY